MDFQKSKTLLEKINALYKNISSDPRNVSSIERDLMRSYIQQFYESFLEMPSVASAITPPQPETPKAPEPRITLRKPEPTPPPPPLKPQPEPPKPETPKVQRIPEPEATPAPAPPSPAEVAKPAPVVETAPPPQASKVAEQLDPDMEELFAFKSATELSEKLSELPISDIKKAMGLNERISTQNELFGGDAAAFDATVSTLNTLKSYDEAKDYLIRNVASKYKWSSKEKKEKAKSFIKLVRRRY